MEITLKVLVDISDKTERALELLGDAFLTLASPGDKQEAEPEIAPEASPEDKREETPGDKPETEPETEPEGTPEDKRKEATEEAPEEKPEDNEPGFDVTDKEGLKGFMADLKTTLLGEGWDQNRTPEIDAMARAINGYLREIARELGADRPTELPRTKIIEFCNKTNQIQLKDGKIVRLPF